MSEEKEIRDLVRLVFEFSQLLGKIIARETSVEGRIEALREVVEKIAKEISKLTGQEVKIKVEVSIGEDEKK